VNTVDAHPSRSHAAGRGGGRGWDVHLAPDQTVALLAAAGCLGAAVVGVLPWSVAALGIAGSCAVVLAVRALLRPWLALIVLVGVEISNVSDVLGFGDLSPFLVALALGLATAVLGILRGQIRLPSSPLALGAALYLASQLISWTVARDPVAAEAVVIRTAKDLVFLAVVMVLMTASERHVDTAKLVVVLFTALAALTIVNQVMFHNATAFGGFSNVPKGVDLGGITARHAGPLRDANFWGRVLVLPLPLALSLWAGTAPARRFAHMRRWCWMVAAMVLAGGIYLSQSRGAILSVGIALLVWFTLAGRRYRRMLIAAPAVIVVVLLLPGLGSRLSTLTQVAEAQDAAGDRSLVERLAVQEIGLAMLAANPATGVGLGNFSTAWAEFRHEAEVMPPRVLAPHNLYLQLAAESGAVGVLGWLMLYGTAVLLAGRALLLSARLPEPDLPAVRLLAAGVIAGLVGWAFASVFLHMAHIRTLMIVMALAAALDARARRTAQIAPLAASDPDHSEGSARWAGLIATGSGFAAAIGVIVAGSLAPPLLAPRWAAEHQVFLEPSHTAWFAEDPYTLDLLSRRTTVQTYAAIVDSPRFVDQAADSLALGPDMRDALYIDVTGSHDSAVIRVMVSGPDPKVARDVSRAVLEHARRYVNSLGAHYAMTAINATAAVPTRIYGLGLAGSVVVLCAAVAAGVLVGLLTLRPHRRSAAVAGAGP
jgi:O-antigen ligase/capsular polysaccharide biosynthesis protein